MNLTDYDTQKSNLNVTRSTNGAADRSKQALSAIEQKASANPWLTLAVVGGGALAAGFLLGRAFFGAAKPVVVPTPTDDEVMAGYDE